MDLQSEYQNPSAGAAPDSSQQAPDLTIPGAMAGQLVQAIQQQDCATVMKILAQAMQAAAQGGGGGDSDMDGM